MDLAWTTPRPLALLRRLALGAPGRRAGACVHVTRRGFGGTPWRASDGLETELTAPNGTKWKQPLGLFIGNQFVKSRDDGRIATVNP